jgi:hypothetical protein
MAFEGLRNAACFADSGVPVSKVQVENSPKTLKIREMDHWPSSCSGL